MKRTIKWWLWAIIISPAAVTAGQKLGLPEEVIAKHIVNFADKKNVV